LSACHASLEGKRVGGAAGKVSSIGADNLLNIRGATNKLYCLYTKCTRDVKDPYYPRARGFQVIFGNSKKQNVYSRNHLPLCTPSYK
jgi:hypothetical protein